MNYMDDASTFEHSLLQKARQKHIPVTGALELLPLCNMNCDMCYVRLSPISLAKVSSGGRFLFIRSCF